MTVLIVGGGAHIYFIARSLISKGKEIIIVNKDSAECEMLSRRLKATVICGDGSQPRTLEEAGIRRARKVLAVTPHDDDNFLICRLAKDVYGIKDAFALVNDPDNEAVFRSLGIGSTFSLSPILSDMIERRAQKDSVIGFTPISEGKINLAEVVLDAQAPSKDKQLKDIRFPKSSLVISVQRAGDVFIPSGDTAMLTGDRISFVCLPENYSQVLGLFVGKD